MRCSPVRVCPAVSCSPSKLHCVDEDQLVNGLREFISLENQLESSKVSLTQKCDFNLHDAFAIFDQHRFG